MFWMVIFMEYVGQELDNMFKYILLGFVLGYAFSFVSPEWYYFVNSNFIHFCRWAELPDVAWIMMDKYIFFGAL